MSNENPEFSLVFLWHNIPIKQKVAAVVILILTVTLAFGLGVVTSAKNDRAPIIIEQCPDSL
ncbi:MAG: hypothetical protein WC519_01880 [Parcubacteria group bacterium]